MKIRLFPYFANHIVIHLSYFSESICDVFEVTNGTRSSTGIYFLSNERAPAAPDLHVWKLEGKDRYIYNTGTFVGWRIGRYSSLSTGKSYYKSKKRVRSSYAY